MRFVCTMRISNESEAVFLRDGLAVLGWTENEVGDAVFSLPADPCAVDAPAVALGRMLTDMLVDGDDCKQAVPATLSCAYRDIVVFSEQLSLFVCKDGRTRIQTDSSVKPFFCDRIRLRDAMLAALQQVHRHR